MGGEQGETFHLKIRQDHLPVHVGRHGGSRVPRLREQSAHLGGRRRLLRPSPPPPPPPGAEGLAGEPAGGPAGRRAGQRGRLGAHAPGNLQAPRPPACAPQSPRRSRRDREVDLDECPVLTVVSQDEGRLRQRAPGSLPRRRDRRGRGNREN